MIEDLARNISSVKAGIRRRLRGQDIHSSFVDRALSSGARLGGGGSEGRLQSDPSVTSQNLLAVSLVPSNNSVCCRYSTHASQEYAPQMKIALARLTLWSEVAYDSLLYKFPFSMIRLTRRAYASPVLSRPKTPLLFHISRPAAPVAGFSLLGFSSAQSLSASTAALSPAISAVT